MRTTASFDLFPSAPSERAMARARYLAREGRVADAESAYRDALQRHPDLKPCWAEYFELLRRQGRAEEALRIAEAALAQFGDSAFPFTLRGAALIELARYREALGALEAAIERDPDLGVAWHELGVAAHRLGDGTRALLALDRAFALEPHSETLKLRGRILREAGRYQAAEVAFEAAAQAAEHDEQREEAEREIAVTRRYAGFAPRRPEDLMPVERWFADTGSAVLAPVPGPVPPSDETLVLAFLELVHELGWRFGQLLSVGPTLPVWGLLAEALDLPVVTRAQLAPDAVPLVVAPRPLPADPAWTECGSALRRGGAGLQFVLEHPAEARASVGADVIGVVTDTGFRRTRMPAPALAAAVARQPGARWAGRRLGSD